jgi:hypothetical protein
MTTKTKITRAVLVLIASLSFLLAACKPEDIVMTNTQLERDVQTYFCKPGNLSNPDCK